MNYENKELWNTDMQVGKPYKATILKNYHILLYVHKSYSIVTFVDALYHLENNIIYWLKSIYAVIILRLSKFLKTFYVYIFFKLLIYWNSNQWWMGYFSLCRHSIRSLVYGKSEWKFYVISITCYRYLWKSVPISSVHSTICCEVMIGGWSVFGLLFLHYISLQWSRIYY